MPAAPTNWDDSWFGRLTAKHKAVFDSPQIEDGLAIANAAGYIRGMHDAINAAENDVQTVIVLRHVAVVMLFNDAMWEKYGIAAEYKVANAEKRNPWSGEMATLKGRGATLIACNLAATRRAREFATRLNLNADDVKKDLYANFVPGVIVQTSGVFATIRAQQAGCAFMKSG